MTQHESAEFLLQVLDTMLTRLRASETIDDLDSMRDSLDEILSMRTEGWTIEHRARLDSLRTALEEALAVQEQKPRRGGSIEIDSRAQLVASRPDAELVNRWIQAGRELFDDPNRFASVFSSMLVEFDGKLTFEVSLENWGRIGEQMVLNDRLRRLLARRTAILELGREQELATS